MFTLTLLYLFCWGLGINNPQTAPVLFHCIKNILFDHSPSFPIWSTFPSLLAFPISFLSLSYPKKHRCLPSSSVSFPLQSNFLKIVVYTLVPMSLFHFNFLACCNIYSTEVTLLKLLLLKTQKILLLLTALDLFSVLSCIALCLCTMPWMLGLTFTSKATNSSWFFICLSRQTFPMSFLSSGLLEFPGSFWCISFLSPRHTLTGHFVQPLFLATTEL